MKIVTIIGARPQFIKASVISGIIKNTPEINEIILHTGQHFDYNMNDVFFKEMQIPAPKYNLQISSLSHGAMIGAMIPEIEKILLSEKPGLVLVYGDTNSTLAGALAAKKILLPVAHVEAGLRSYNMNMPEEQNRLITDRISDILFCPTQNAYANLVKEDIVNSPYKQKVHITGDVMYDAVLHHLKIAGENSRILQVLNPANKKFILCTIHRAENTDNPDNLDKIFKALNEISEQFEIILPLHPRTKKIISSNKSIMTSGIKIIEPVSYFDMLVLEKNCLLVITDSGGIQKEAYFLSKPCLTLRNETEWTELADLGVNFVCGANPFRIMEAFQKSIAFSSDNFAKNIYGDGRAGENIVNIIKNL